jgi:isopentenyldiphosphate isomerase
MAEQFDIYTPDGTRHIGVKDRADVHRDGDWHRSVHIWIVRPAENAVVIQQRAANKDTWPNSWDASVGGHLSAGASCEDALREIDEELGVRIHPDTFVPLGVRAIELNPPTQPDITDRELRLVALAIDERPLDAYPFDHAELSAIASLPVIGLRALMAGREAVIRTFDGGAATVVTTTPDELIPQPYLADLADAAERLLEPPEEASKMAMKAP